MTATTSLKSKKLGSIFLALGLIDERQQSQAVAYARALGCPIGQACVRLGFITERTVVDALAVQLGVPTVSLAGAGIPAAVLALVSRDVASRLRVIPLGLTPGKGGRWILQVAISDPRHLTTLDEVEFATGHRVSPVLTDDADMDEGLRRFYAVRLSAEELVDLEDGPGFEHVVKAYIRPDLTLPTR